MLLPLKDIFGEVKCKKPSKLLRFEGFWVKGLIMNCLAGRFYAGSKEINYSLVN